MLWLCWKDCLNVKSLQFEKNFSKLEKEERNLLLKFIWFLVFGGNNFYRTSRKLELEMLSDVWYIHISIIQFYGCLWFPSVDFMFISPWEFIALLSISYREISMKNFCLYSKCTLLYWNTYIRVKAFHNTLHFHCLSQL